MSMNTFAICVYLFVNIICLNVRVTVADSKTFKPVTHVIFDLDGTLIDSESLYKAAGNVVTTRYGKGEFTWEHKTNLMGTNLRKNAGLIITAFNLTMTEDQLFNEVMDAFRQIIRKEVRFMPGAERIVKHFYDNKVPMSLCTADRKETYDIKVSHFGDFFKPGKYFDVVVIAGSDPEITHNKPDPEPYLVTMKRLKGNPKPENVLIFEDSIDGMKSAMASGAQCVMIPDCRADYGDATSVATLVIKSLNDFDPKLFGLPPFQDTNAKNDYCLP